MSIKIYKYILQITDVQELVLPKEYKILSVQEQNGNLCLWSLVDAEESAATTKITIEIIGTGNPIEMSKQIERIFLGTVQISHLVWHVFQRI